MANFPPEIIASILCRLPVMELLRSRCVSKSWRSMIDGPDFVRMHVKQSMETNSNTGLVLADYQNCEVFWVDVNTLDVAVKLTKPAEDLTEPKVFGSCNGLLGVMDMLQLALWNPSTRRFKEIPSHKMVFPPGFRICKSLIYGLGHDPSEDSYKVVRIRQLARHYISDDLDYNGVDVYNTKSNTWKAVSEFPYCFRLPFAFGVLVSNALHWVVYQTPEADASPIIVAFDLVSENYHEIPPPDSTVQYCHMGVGALGESLCVAYYYPMDCADFDATDTTLPTLDHVDIWIMKEYGKKESWTKLLTLEPSSEIGSFSFVVSIAYWKTNKNHVLINLGFEKLILYDAERRMVKNVTVFEIPKKFETHLCLESLVDLDGMTTTEKPAPTRQQPM